MCPVIKILYKAVFKSHKSSQSHQTLQLCRGLGFWKTVIVTLRAKNGGYYRYFTKMKKITHPLVFFFLLSCLFSWTRLRLRFKRIRKFVTSSIIFVMRPSLVKKLGNISSLAAMHIFSFCHQKANCVKDSYLPLRRSTI